jgi:hypothetical protein
VQILISLAAEPIDFLARSSISTAAFLVKVLAAIWAAGKPVSIGRTIM